MIETEQILIGVGPVGESAATDRYDGNLPHSLSPPFGSDWHRMHTNKHPYFKSIAKNMYLIYGSGSVRLVLIRKSCARPVEGRRSSVVVSDLVPFDRSPVRAENRKASGPARSGGCRKSGEKKK